MGSAQSKFEEPGKQRNALVKNSTPKSTDKEIRPIHQYSLTLTFTVPSVSLQPMTYYNNSPLPAFVSATSRAVRRVRQQLGLSYFRFLDLPPEIRSMIYEEVLVVGRVFFTPDDYDLANSERCAYHTNFRKPELQLLHVCKQIHAEAEPVYLSKNMFVLPLEWNMHPHFAEHIANERAGRSIFSNAGLSIVRNINIAFDPRICDSRFKGFGAHFWGHERWGWDSPREAFSKISSADRLLQMHEYSDRTLEDSWGKMADSLEPFETGMDHVEVDFTNAFCLAGDCRPVHLTDVGTLLHLTRPKNLDIYGLLTRAEQVYFIKEAREYGYTYKILKYRHGLHFRKTDEDSPWDRWMIKEPSRSLSGLEGLEFGVE